MSLQGSPRRHGTQTLAVQVPLQQSAFSAHAQVSGMQQVVLQVSVQHSRPALQADPSVFNVVTASGGQVALAPVQFSAMSHVS